MAQTFSAANTLGRGLQLKSNLESAQQTRDIQQRTFNADQQLANSQKLLFGFGIIKENPSITPKVLEELANSGIISPETIPQMLAEAQSNPLLFAQKMSDAEAKVKFQLGQAPQFGAPVAGQDLEGNALFRRFSPTGSRDVEGFVPLAGGGTSTRGRFFGDLTEDLSPQDQELARRIQLGLEPRAVGSANITIAEDEDLTEDVAESQATIAQRKKFGEATGALRSKLIDKGFESIKNIDVNLRNLDKAIVALNEGAKTGVIETKFFPTIRASTVKLEQIQSELGLDVVGGVTFGALSKGELDLALTVALPVGLQPAELLQWLQDKKLAQEKLRAYYAEQIDFLDRGGSIAGFLRSKQRQGNADPNAAQGGNNEQLIQQANEAIAAGADPQAVRQRLAELGVEL